VVFGPSVLLRIGHSLLMHSYLLSGDDIPECGTCQCPLTVKHVQMEFVASSIKDLFENVERQNIIDFIKETPFYK